MCEEETFDLSQYLTDSLILSSNGAAQTRHMFPSSIRDPYLKIFEQDPSEVLGIKSFGSPKYISEDTLGTPIQEFFRGLNVFITGGTGFIGKIIIEKLIRSIPHLKQIYILIRPKRGKSSKERFDQLLEDQVFMRMKTEVPDYRTKLTVVEGDISEPDMGLSDADHQMLSECINVVFHSAADVRFIEPLKVAINSNVLGSKRVMDLARGMQHLRSYIFVSTAYSQCVRKEVPESVPKMSIDYKEVIDLVQHLPDEELQEEIPRLMQGWPNTYTFSKAVCEDMVQEEAEGLPICIFRPSVVGPTYKEPIRGWTDNVYGPTGMLLGAALGVLHCFMMDTELNTDIVAVDYMVNCMIAAAWQTGTSRHHDVVPVYNFTSTPLKAMTWKTIIGLGLRYKTYWPIKQAIWYISFFPTTSYIVNKTSHLFLHKIPGKILDSLATLAGQKPRLSKIYKTIETVQEALVYFTLNNWHFENENVKELWRSMGEEDQEEFHFDNGNIDIKEHFLLGKLGVRYYLLKEKMETIPAAERKNKWLKIAHYSLKTVSGLVFLKLLVSIAHILPI